MAITIQLALRVRVTESAEKSTSPDILTTSQELPEPTQVRLKPSLAKTLGNVVEMPRRVGAK